MPEFLPPQSRHLDLPRGTYGMVPSRAFLSTPLCRNRTRSSFPTRWMWRDARLSRLPTLPTLPSKTRNTRPTSSWMLRLNLGRATERPTCLHELARTLHQLSYIHITKCRFRPSRRVPVRPSIHGSHGLWDLPACRPAPLFPAHSTSGPFFPLLRP